MPVRDAEPGTPSPDVVPLLAELNDLKRVRSAGRDGTIATRLFRQAWSELVAGRPACQLAFEVAARALAAARLGDLDRSLLSSVGLSRAQITRVLQQAVAETGVSLPDVVRQPLHEAVAADRDRPTGPLPDFVAVLEQQPRAGVTCPGKPRIVLEPPESHAEHCLVVAVYGVILAPTYGADVGTVFLAALSHHFHNAGMPDSGFTGEMLLGPHLAKVMAHFTDGCLDQLEPPLRDAVEAARTVLTDGSTPEGCAFHAADALDRVLQIKQYLVASSLTMDRVMGDMALVHDGPVKGFQDAVLRHTGLL